MRETVADLVKAFRQSSAHIRRLHAAHHGVIHRAATVTVTAYERNFTELRRVERRLRTLRYFTLALNLRIEHDLAMAAALGDHMSPEELNASLRVVQNVTRWQIEVALGRP